jgi:hypothetical protein
MEKAVSELKDVLLELRYAGVRELPETGDTGDYRVRQALEQEITRPRRRFGLTRRKVAIGGFGVTPAVLVVVVATAAAATGGAVFAANVATKRAAKQTTTTATKPRVTPAAQVTAIFRKNPGYPEAHRNLVPPHILFRPETVIAATVHDRDNAAVPNYGTVQFWAATTKQGGFCSAIRLPNGTWAGYPLSQHPSGGFYGGSMPNCIDTDQQRSIGENGQPSLEAPTTFEWSEDEVKTRTGKTWELFFGYVTTQGHATTVKDPTTGRAAAVNRAGYFLLAEPLPSGGESTMVDVLNAAGEVLQPDYTRSGLLPGYRMGPTRGV